MAQLSGLFYKAYIYNSGCGNFASNLTASFHENTQNCSGTLQNPSLSGRDIHMIQKRVFGGLKLSDRFLDWATIPGTTLETLLETKSDFTERRQTKHHVVCNADALFHPNKGIAGMRLEFLQNVLVDSVSMSDFYNGGDFDHWLCRKKYQLYSTKEQIHTVNWKPGRHLGADIRGVAIGKC